MTYTLDQISQLERGQNVHFFARRSNGVRVDHVAIYVPHDRREPVRSSTDHALTDQMIDVAHQAIAYWMLNGSVEGFPPAEFW